MRLLLVSLVACVAGTLAGVGMLYASARFIYQTEVVSAAELSGVAGLSFIFSAVMCGVLYAPGLFMLRRLLGGCRPALSFLFTSAIALNFPAAVVLVAGMRAGMFSGVSEVALFLSAFAVTGLVFGGGYVWNCRRRERAPRPAAS